MISKIEHDIKSIFSDEHEKYLSTPITLSYTKLDLSSFDDMTKCLFGCYSLEGKMGLKKLKTISKKKTLKNWLDEALNHYDFFKMTNALESPCVKYTLQTSKPIINIKKTESIFTSDCKSLIFSSSILVFYQGATKYNLYISPTIILLNKDRFYAGFILTNDEVYSYINGYWYKEGNKISLNTIEKNILNKEKCIFYFPDFTTKDDLFLHHYNKKLYIGTDSHFLKLDYIKQIIPTIILPIDEWKRKISQMIIEDAGK